MRCLVLLFVGLSSRPIFAKDEIVPFNDLVEIFYKKRADSEKKVAESPQKYSDEIYWSFLEQGESLSSALAENAECKIEARSKLDRGKIDIYRYKEETQKCVEEWDKDIFDVSSETQEDIRKKQQSVQNQVAKIEAELERHLFDIASSTTGYYLTSEEQIKLDELKQELEQDKKEHEKLLRTIDHQFNDTLCIEIQNVKRELYPHEAKYIAKLLVPFLLKDLTFLGFDHYCISLHLANQTLVEAGAEMEEESRRSLSEINDGGYLGTRILHTEWEVQMGCSMCTRRVVGPMRELAQDQAENEEKPLHRFLEGFEIESLPEVEKIMKHILETRLNMIVQNFVVVQEKVLLNEGSANSATLTSTNTMTASYQIATSTNTTVSGSPAYAYKNRTIALDATVHAKPCGAWPLTDAVITVNPDILEELQDFVEARGKIEEKEKEETKKYEEKAESEYLKLREALAKEELKYMSCMNDIDKKYIENKISEQEREQLYIECFNEYDDEGNSIREKFVESMKKEKEEMSKKISDLNGKTKNMVEKLEIEIFRSAVKNHEEHARALEQEKKAAIKTQEEIEKEQRKLYLKFNEGIMCRIEHVTREFTDGEIPILSELVQRGSNHAFHMCDIDLYMYDAVLLDQKFVNNRYLKRDSDRRRLGTKLTVRFSSLCECTRCTVCEAYKDSVSSGTCDCCKRRRLFLDDGYRRASVTACFDTYMTPRVKKLIEARLKDAIQDGMKEVLVDCSLIDL